MQFNTLREEVFYSLVILFLNSLFIFNWNITGFEDRHHQGKHVDVIKLRLVSHLNRKTIFFY